MQAFRRTAATIFVPSILAVWTGACDLPPTESGSTDDAPPAVSDDTNTAPTTGVGGASAKWELWSSGETRLRGVDLHPCKLTGEDEQSCDELTTQLDVQDVVDLGANLINASYAGVFREQPPYEADAERVQELDDLIAWAEDIGVYVVINMRTGPGRNEAAIQVALGFDTLTDVWTDQAAHDGWIDMWRFIAERYGSSPVVIGYDLMVEPHVNTWLDPDGQLDPIDFRQRHAGTLGDWNAFAQEITTAIREIDEETPIVVDSLQWANVSWFSALRPTNDQRTVYSLHAYDPDLYISQFVGALDITYPSVVVDEGERIEFNREWLADNLEPAVAFAREHDVPIYVGEFGLFRWVPGGAAFIADEIALFEERGWNYAYYAWRGDVVGFDAFNMEFGSDPADTSPVSDNQLLSAFTAGWSRNTDLPDAAE